MNSLIPQKLTHTFSLVIGHNGQTSATAWRHVMPRQATYQVLGISQIPSLCNRPQFSLTLSHHSFMLNSRAAQVVQGTTHYYNYCQLYTEIRFI